jgi:hypothetical protein
MSYAVYRRCEFFWMSEQKIADFMFEDEHPSTTQYAGDIPTPPPPPPMTKHDIGANDGETVVSSIDTSTMSDTLPSHRSSTLTFAEELSSHFPREDLSREGADASDHPSLTSSPSTILVLDGENDDTDFPSLEKSYSPSVRSQEAVLKNENMHERLEALSLGDTASRMDTVPQDEMDLNYEHLPFVR